MAQYIDEAHPELTEEKLDELLKNITVPMTDKVPLESLSNIFKIPENPQLKYENFGETFERYKVKIDLFKWLIGTIGLTIITFIINWGFRDREQGMNEISQYDKYASELIVLNDNPVKKRMLAQFFANVTPSEKLKKGWEKYYYEVNLEYDKFMADALVVKEKLEKLKKIDSTKQTAEQKSEVKSLETKVNENESKINAPMLVPELTSNLEGNIKAVLYSSFTKTNIKDSISANEFEKKGFSSLLEKDIDNSIMYFIKSENSYNSYHMVYEIAKYLKESKSKIQSEPEYWNIIYKVILEKYSWKIPEKYKRELQNNIK